MILDTLRSAGYYFPLGERIEAGLAFIQDAVRGALEDGEYEIDGRNVYAVISSGEGGGKAGARLESHRRYMDIHYCLQGEDIIGWGHIDDCSGPASGYNEEKDVQFYPDIPGTWLSLGENSFCVFFPHDAHAPFAGEGACRKLVVKAAV
jgi:YhcH/YjgK/YiaL family protein